MVTPRPTSIELWSPEPITPGWNSSCPPSPCPHVPYLNVPLFPHVPLPHGCHLQVPMSQYLHVPHPHVPVCLHLTSPSPSHVPHPIFSYVTASRLMSPCPISLCLMSPCSPHPMSHAPLSPCPPSPYLMSSCPRPPAPIPCLWVPVNGRHIPDVVRASQRPPQGHNGGKVLLERSPHMTHPWVTDWGLGGTWPRGAELLAPCSHHFIHLHRDWIHRNNINIPKKTRSHQRRRVQ